jgi:hypothetical protein
MVRLPALLIAMGLFAACERSNRNIEVQPPSKKDVLQDDKTGSDDFINVFTTGSLKLVISGFPASSSSAAVTISGLEEPVVRTLSLVSGQGVTTLTDLAPGSVDISVRSVIGSVTYNGTTNLSVSKGMVTTGNIKMQASSNPTPTPNPDPQVTPMPQPTPQPGSPSGSNGGGGVTPSNNDSSIDIGVDIGSGSKPNQGSTPPSGNIGGSGSGSSNLDIGIDIGRPPSSNQGGQVVPQQNIWDGKSFQGNSMFSIEPID